MVNERQTLEAIRKELDDQGYKYEGKLDGTELHCVVTYRIDGSYAVFTKAGKNHYMVEHPIHKIVTLEQLKELRYES